MMTASVWQVHQNHYQYSEAAINCQINLELYASYVCLSYLTTFDDVALRNFAKYFIHQSPEEREHAEKVMKLQNPQSGRIFLQDIEKPDHHDWESGLNAMECSLLELHKLTHYLNEQVKSIKELGNVCMLGFPLPFL
uniref:Ferritin n=1 Tax=Saimiri boliviensis boliviensis TaxID=39432 RepID=A0A2K6S757_SAIBB